MTPTTESTSAPQAPREKPRLALAIATAFGVGYLPKAPGTFGSLVGVATVYLSAAFFLRPTSPGALFSFHPNYDAVLMDKHFLVPGSDLHDAVLALPIFCALVLVVLRASPQSCIIHLTICPRLKSVFGEPSRSGAWEGFRICGAGCSSRTI